MHKVHGIGERSVCSETWNAPINRAGLGVPHAGEPWSAVRRSEVRGKPRRQLAPGTGESGENQKTLVLGEVWTQGQVCSPLWRAAGERFWRTRVPTSHGSALVPSLGLTSDIA